MMRRARMSGQASVAAALLLTVAALGSGAFLALGDAKRSLITEEATGAASQEGAASEEGDHDRHGPSPALTSTQSAGTSSLAEPSMSESLLELPFVESEERPTFGSWVKNTASQAVRIPFNRENQYAAEMGMREVATGLTAMLGMIPIGLNNLIEKVPFADPRPFHEGEEARAMLDGMIQMGGFRENGNFNGFMSLGSTLMGPAIANEFKAFGSHNSLNGSWAMGAWVIDILPWLGAFSPYAYTQGVSPLMQSARAANRAAKALPPAALFDELRYAAGESYHARAFDLADLSKMDPELRNMVELKELAADIWVRGQDLDRPRSEIFDDLRTESFYQNSVDEIGSQAWEDIFVDAHRDALRERGIVEPSSPDELSNRAAASTLVQGEQLSELLSPAADGYARRPSGLFVPDQGQGRYTRKASGLLAPGSVQDGFGRRPTGLLVPSRAQGGYARRPSGLLAPGQTEGSYMRRPSGLWTTAKTDDGYALQNGLHVPSSSAP